MGKLGGFLEIKRQTSKEISPQERIENYHEFHKVLNETDAVQQSARCMECGIPFCHNACPVANVIPEFNDFVYRGLYKEALEILESTNNFPEFTGRVCPAPCEAGCVLNIQFSPVAIKEIELFIVEKGFLEGWIIPKKSKIKREKKVAIIGSGPTGLACAQELTRKGFEVTVYEKDEVAGGLLVLGIPDYKIEKKIVERRINQLIDEGVNFILNTQIGHDISLEKIRKEYDAVVLCIGAKIPREFSVASRKVKGVYHAMEWLTEVNRKNRESTHFQNIDVKGKKVLIIGGGDTGADCIGTTLREGASSIIQIIRKSNYCMSETSYNLNWPYEVQEFSEASSHQESKVAQGVDIRQFETVCTHFGVNKNQLINVNLQKIYWYSHEGKKYSKPVEGSEKCLEMDVVLLALGFQGADKLGLENVEFDEYGSIKTDVNFMTSFEGVFAAGDAKIGQSLVVTAIAQGRAVAQSVLEYLER